MAHQHQDLIALLQHAHAAEQAALRELAHRLRSTRELSCAERLGDLAVDAERRRREVSEQLARLGAGPAMGKVLRALAEAALRAKGPTVAARRSYARLAAAAGGMGDRAALVLAERHRREWDALTQRERT